MDLRLETVVLEIILIFFFRSCVLEGIGKGSRMQHVMIHLGMMVKCKCVR
jgi:hypothetical protein